MSQLPPLTAERRRQRSALANARRLRPDDPETANIDREYRAARLADYIRQQVDAAPPLTDTQRDELARILRPAADAPTPQPDFMSELVEAALGSEALDLMPDDELSMDLDDEHEDGLAS